MMFQRLILWMLLLSDVRFVSSSQEPQPAGSTLLVSKQTVVVDQNVMKAQSSWNDPFTVEDHRNLQEVDELVPPECLYDVQVYESARGPYLNMVNFRLWYNSVAFFDEETKENYGVFVRIFDNRRKAMVLWSRDGCPGPTIKVSSNLQGFPGPSNFIRCNNDVWEIFMTATLNPSSPSSCVTRGRLPDITSLPADNGEDCRYGVSLFLTTPVNEMLPRYVGVVFVDGGVRELSDGRVFNFTTNSDGTEGTLDFYWSDGCFSQLSVTATVNSDDFGESTVSCPNGSTYTWLLRVYLENPSCLAATVPPTTISPVTSPITTSPTVPPTTISPVTSPTTTSPSVLPTTLSPLASPTTTMPSDGGSGGSTPGSTGAAISTRGTICLVGSSSLLLYLVF